MDYFETAIGLSVACLYFVFNKKNDTHGNYPDFSERIQA